MRYHLTLVRMSTIQKSTKNKCLRGCREKGTLLYAGGNANQYSHCGDQHRDCFKNWKQNCHTTQQSHCWSYIPRKSELKEHMMYSKVHCSTVYNSQDMEATQMPSADEWIRKLWYIYTMEYYLAIKRNASESVLMRWMKMEPIIQSEVSQEEKH